MLPAAPYKFLDWFGRHDQSIFFGRDEEADRLVRFVNAEPLSVLIGESGVGKTSMLHARVIPWLEDEGFKVSYLRMLSDPREMIIHAVRSLSGMEHDAKDHDAKLTNLRAFLEAYLPYGTRVVFIIDQFEEFFIRFGPAIQKDFANQLVDCMHSTVIDVRFVLSLRREYVDQLLELDPPLKQIFDKRVVLRNLDEGRAREAITKPAKAFGVEVEDDLITLLLRSLDAGGIEPPHLQIICHRLYESRTESNRLTLDQYYNLGGLDILARYLDEVFDSLESDKDRLAARAIVKSMVTNERTRIALSAHEISRDAIVREVRISENEVRMVLKALQDRRLIRSITMDRKPNDDSQFGAVETDEMYELSHEIMVRKVWEWLNDDEIKHKYAQQLLRQSLGDWKQMKMLPDIGRWGTMNEERQTLNLDREEIVFLLEASLHLETIAQNKYWIERAQQSEVDVGAGLSAILGYGTPAARQNALDWVVNIQPPNMLSILAETLYSIYPALQRRARRALQNIASIEAQEILAMYPAPSDAILIPAGWFPMGSDAGTDDERPVHQVYVDAFYMHRFTVTNHEYQVFVESTGRIAPKHWIGGQNPPGKEDHPVVYVSWYDAVAYCEWLSQRTGIPYRLPTEAEWEKAASWDPMLEHKRIWAWGDEFDSSKANVLSSKIYDTTPVGQYSASGGDSAYGLSDMSGNTFDWVYDWFASDYYSVSPGHNPKGPDKGENKVSRAGSYAGSDDGANTYSRDYQRRPNVLSGYIGFRLAIDAGDALSDEML